jgi:hypothetical protein
MQDRPTTDELLAFIERFLDDEIVPNTPGSRGFHARVAANALRIVRRELQQEEPSLAAEWAGLVALLGPAERPPESAAFAEALRARNQELCERIRRGEADESAVLQHLRRTIADKLRISDPGLLDRSATTPPAS